MTVLLFLVLPLLVEASVVEVPPSGGSSCGLPPPSKEKLHCSPANTWYVQYQYRVPGHFDLGCSTFHLTQGKLPNELRLNATFSRIPEFPMDGSIRMYGNRYQTVFNGIWNCAMSGPLNVVYCDPGIYILHSCFLGHELSQIFTSVRKPSEKMMARIWQLVEDLPEVDKHKYVKVVC